MYYGTEMCVKFWDQKVTVQSHGGVRYAGTITAQACQVRLSSLTVNVLLSFVTDSYVNCCNVFL